MKYKTRRRAGEAVKRLYVFMALSLLLPMFNFLIVPSASAITTDTDNGQNQCTQSIDTVIIMDLSNSMGECTGVNFSEPLPDVSESECSTIGGVWDGDVCTIDFIDPSGLGRSACEEIMGGTWVEPRLNQAKDLANYYVGLLGGLDTPDQVGLVSFATEVEDTLPLGSDFSAVSTAISDLTSGQGGTNLGAGLQEAVNMLNSGNGQDKKILVFSDGDPTLPQGTAEADVVTAYNNAASQGVKIYAFDMDTQSDATNVMQDMASATQGDYYDGMTEDSEIMQGIYDSNKYTECQEVPGTVVVCKQDADSNQYLNGWEINLRNQAGELVNSGYTGDSAYNNPDGCVVFEDVTPGDYELTETMQSGWTQVQPTSGSFTVTVIDGYDNTDDPFIFVNKEETEPTGSLTICKYEDLNGDGELEDGEPTVQGWTFYMGQETYTDGQNGDEPDGCVTVTDLPYGEYTVNEESRTGWNQTGADGNGTLDNGSVTVVISDNNSHPYVYFLNQQEQPTSGDICVIKFNDHNQNGQLDENENMLSDWNFELTKYLETVEVDVQGNVRSTSVNIIPGKTYLLVAEGTYTYINNNTTSGLADAEWSDRPDFSFGPGWVAKGETEFNNPNGLDVMVDNTNIDWGDYNPSHVYKHIYTAVSNNISFHIEDNYYGDNYTTDGDPIRVSIYEYYTGSTDNDGEYCFEDLEFGDYDVSEVMQDGWFNSTPVTQSVSIDEGNTPVTVYFGNYQEHTGDDICGYKYEVNEQGEELGVLSGWPMSLWSASQVLSFEVPANDLAGYTPDFTFESGKTYKIEVTGTAWAGDGIYFDAKYSERNNSGSWTDDVQNYESYGPELLDLQINGSSPDWGDYNSDHTYFIVREGDNSVWNFAIYDIYPQNNEGSLSVVVYELTDTGLTASTNDNGYYCFENLEPGHYVVQEGSQDGYSAYGSEYCQIADTSLAENLCNFYNYSTYEEPTGEITVCKYYDHDNDGQYDPQGLITGAALSLSDYYDYPLNNWIIDLNDGQYSGETGNNDNAAGCVTFEVPYGEYTITEEPPAEEANYHWIQTYPGGDESQTVTIDSENNNETVYFLNVKADIWGCKYDSEENLLGGWGINIYEPGENTDEWSLLQSTVTEDNESSPNFGCYYFTNLAEGSYRLDEDLVDGWSQIEPENGYYEFSLGADESNSYDFINQEDNTNSGGGDCTTNCGSPGGGTPTTSGGGSTSNNTGTPSEEPTVKGFTAQAPEIVKTVNKVTVNPGETITYNVSITNSGDIDLTGVKVTDTLPNGFVFVDTQTANKTWEIGVLPANSTQDFTYDVKIDAEIAAGEYANKAVLLSNEFDPLEDQAIVNVVPVKVLGYEKIPETGGGDSNSYSSLLLYFGLIMIVLGISIYRKIDINEQA